MSASGDVEGTRAIEPEPGKLELSLDTPPTPTPLHFDPTLVVVGCMDGLILASAPIGNEVSGGRLAWPFGPDEVSVHLDTRVTIYDEVRARNGDHGC